MNEDKDFFFFFFFLENEDKDIFLKTKIKTFVWPCYNLFFVNFVIRSILSKKKYGHSCKSINPTYSRMMNFLKRLNMAGEGGGLRKQNHFAKSKQPIKSLNYQQK